MEQEDFSLSSLMRAPYVVPETKKIRALLRELQSKRVHMAIVVDEFGVTAGLVTLEDIVEELVGEIQDEFDDERPVVERRVDGGFLVNAHASVGDVNTFLPIPIPESAEYSTVAGYMNVIFSGIPEIGKEKEIEGYTVKISKRSRGSVDAVVLYQSNPDDAEDDTMVQ